MIEAAPARPLPSPRAPAEPGAAGQPPAGSDDPQALRDGFRRSIARAARHAGEGEDPNEADAPAAAPRGYPPVVALPANTPRESEKEPTHVRAEGPDGPAPGADGDAAPSLAAATGTDRAPVNADMTARFAERLRMDGSRSSETVLLLDPLRYSVSEVTIRGQPAAGLSIQLKREQDGSAESDGQEDERRLESLRARLDARAIPVLGITRSE